MTPAWLDAPSSLSDWLTTQLWREGETARDPQVYALLDGARDPVIEPWVRSSGVDYRCLYAGELAPSLAAAAPYLIHLVPRTDASNKLLASGWGESWGCFVVAPAQVTLDDLHKHFRTLLRVKDASGRILVFRFYDPRVLSVYLPTCTEEERALVFGPATLLLTESATADALIHHPLGCSASTAALPPMAANTSYGDRSAC